MVKRFVWQVFFEKRGDDFRFESLFIPGVNIKLGRELLKKLNHQCSKDLLASRAVGG